jgi:hypothetical protein
MYYYFDETADQGYVDKTSTLDEYGILAGLAFPERKKEEYENRFDEVLFLLKQDGYKKLHCTEIFKDDENEKVREELYQIFLELNEYLIIYEGAYSVGVKQHDEFLSEAVKKTALKRPDHIKVNKTHSRTRLYTTLLTGVIVKLEECATQESETEVHMVSDRVDPKIQKEAENLLYSLQSNKSSVTARSFNTETIVKTEISYDIEIKSELASVSRIKSLSYEDRVTPLSFAADFLCFEMLRHFRRKMKIQKPIKFHSEDILEGFCLKNKVAFIGDNYFSDLVFEPKTIG